MRSLTTTGTLYDHCLMNKRGVRFTAEHFAQVDTPPLFFCASTTSTIGIDQLFFDFRNNQQPIDTHWALLRGQTTGFHLDELRPLLNAEP